MRSQAILLAVPSVAMGIAGFAILGPGAVRPFEAAEVWGGPYLGLSRVSLRITGIESMRGIESMHDVGTVVVRAGDGVVEKSGACQPRFSATCEVELTFGAPVANKLYAVVTKRATGDVLAEGTLDADPALWGLGRQTEPAMKGSSRGALAVRAFAMRGVLAAPFVDRLLLEVRRDGAAVPYAKLVVSADGAELDSSPPERSAARTTDASGRALIATKPFAHDVSLEASAEAPDGARGTFAATLPIVPGAPWLDPSRSADAPLHVVSPITTNYVFAAVASATRRLWGGAIELHDDGTGFSVGTAELPAAARETKEPLWLVLSSDPARPIVGWPLSVSGSTEEPQPERVFRDELLLDGTKQAERRQDDRRKRARVVSGCALGAAAVLEGFLLAGVGPRGKGSWLWLVLAIATVVLSFAAVEVVVLWKTTG